MTGPPPKPTALKILAGNPGKRRLNRDEPAGIPLDPATPPEAPDWIGSYGQELWKRQAALDIRRGVLTRDKLPAYEALCEAYDLYRTASAELAKGLTHETPNNGTSVRPEVTVRKQAFADFKALLLEFGWTAAAASRIAVPSAGKSKSKWDGLLGGRAAGS